MSRLKREKPSRGGNSTRQLTFYINKKEEIEGAAPVQDIVAQFPIATMGNVYEGSCDTIPCNWQVLFAPRISWGTPSCLSFGSSSPGVNVKGYPWNWPASWALSKKSVHSGCNPEWLQFPSNQLPMYTAQFQFYFLIYCLPLMLCDKWLVVFLFLIYFFKCTSAVIFHKRICVLRCFFAIFLLVSCTIWQTILFHAIFRWFIWESLKTHGPNIECVLPKGDFRCLASLSRALFLIFLLFAKLLLRFSLVLPQLLLLLISCRESRNSLKSP